MQHQYISDAQISPCDKYRFRLWRIWNNQKPKALFIMHYPSTAGRFENDKTIQFCIKFAKAWKYGSIYIGNLTPLRCTDSATLKEISVQEQILEKNRLKINEMIDECQLHILAFGNIKPIYRKENYLPNINWHCLGINKSGDPRQPLYLPMNLQPMLMTEEQKNKIKLVTE